MSEANSILHMTEHGAYVWPSYAVVALVLIVLVITSLRTLRRTEKDLKQAESDAGTTRNEA